jgi:glutathione S-transferase
MSRKDPVARAAYWQEYRSRPGVAERLRAKERAARASDPEKYRERDRRRLRKHYAQICVRQLSRRFCFGDLRAERLGEVARLEASGCELSVWDRFALSFARGSRDHFADDQAGDAADRWLRLRLGVLGGSCSESAQNLRTMRFQVADGS